MSIWDSLSRGLGRRGRADGVYDELSGLTPETLASIAIKAFANPQIGNSVWDEPVIREDHPWEDPKALRRAIHDMSNYYNVLGTYRSNFVKSDNDLLASNAYFAVMEKRIMDKLGTLPWEVVDKRDEPVEDVIDFLEYPNPQDTLGDVLKASGSDLVRYDAGAIVKSFNRRGTIQELKAYPGTEFWKEIDRVPAAANLGPGGPLVDSEHMIGLWSHGYTQRYWQRSRPGIYLSFDPEEVCYLSMYQRSDNVYGTDFISRLKYQIQYLIDSTRAAGRTFSNGLVPSIVWGHPQTMDMKSLQQRIEEVKRSNIGSYKFGSVLHTVGEEQVSTLAQKLHDMEWLEGQKMVASLVWTMFGFKAEEFMGGDVNRATAYISYNSTKASALYPILAYYEKMINREILPYMDGYSKDKKWKFRFIKDIDLDDEVKRAEMAAQKANTYSIYYSSGIAPKSALKLAGISDNPDLMGIEYMSQEEMTEATSTGTVSSGDKGSSTSHKSKEKKDFTADGGLNKPERAPNNNYKIDMGGDDNNMQKATGKVIKLTKDGVEITVVPRSPTIYTKRNHASIDLGHELKRIIMKKTGHNRVTMQRFSVWNKVLPAFIEKHDLTRVDEDLS